MLFFELILVVACVMQNLVASGFKMPHRVIFFTFTPIKALLYFEVNLLYSYKVIIKFWCVLFPHLVVDNVA